MSRCTLNIDSMLLEGCVVNAKSDIMTKRVYITRIHRDKAVGYPIHSVNMTSGCFCLCKNMYVDYSHEVEIILDDINEITRMPSRSEYCNILSKGKKHFRP